MPRQKSASHRKCFDAAVALSQRQWPRWLPGLGEFAQTDCEEKQGLISALTAQQGSQAAQNYVNLLGVALRRAGVCAESQSQRVVKARVVAACPRLPRQFARVLCSRQRNLTSGNTASG